MGLLGKLKTGAALLKAWRAIEQEVKVAGAKATFFGIGAAVVTAVIAAFTAQCPGLLDNWPQILLAGILAGVGKWQHSGRSK